jgi:hypothetical protein
MALTTLLPASGEIVNELPFSVWAYGAVALVLFLALLAVTLSFGKGRPHA